MSRCRPVVRRTAYTIKITFPASCDDFLRADEFHAVAQCIWQNGAYPRSNVTGCYIRAWFPTVEDAERALACIERVLDLHRPVTPLADGRRP